jgi:hypothetical protein
MAAKAVIIASAQTIVRNLVMKEVSLLAPKDMTPGSF